MKKFISVLLCFFILSGITSCSQDNEPTKNMAYYNLSNEPVTLDPQVAEDNSAFLIIKNIFEGLVKIGDGGEIVCAGASSYTVNEDYSNFVFTIREGACWSNGENVTSSDYAFGITRALSPEINSSIPKGLFLIKNAKEYHEGKVDSGALGIKCFGNGTLNIQLKEGNKDFLYTLAEAAAMPCNEKFFNSTGGQYGKSSDTIISNGAYCIKSNYGWTHDEYLGIVENTYYNGSFKPKLSGIDFTIGKEIENPVEAVRNGTVDACAADISNLNDAKKAGLTISESAFRVWGITFNLKSKELSNENVRKALLKSLNRDKLIDLVPEYYQEADYIINKSINYSGKSYRSQTAISFQLDYDEKASEYMKSALNELNIDKLSNITIICSNDSETQSVVSEIIASWNKISGCYANKEPVSEKELIQRIADEDYSIAFAPIEYISSEVTECLEAVSFDDNKTIVNVNNDEYKKIIDKLSDTDSNSFEVCTEAESYLINSYIFYPVYYENSIFIANPLVTGISYNFFDKIADFTKADKTEKD